MIARLRSFGLAYAAWLLGLLVGGLGGAAAMLLGIMAMLKAKGLIH